MSVFIGKGIQTIAARTILTVLSTATIRPRIQKLKGQNLGQITLDSQIEILCSRITTAGTTTAYTPGGPDPNDPANTVIFGSNATVEPTYTANSLEATLLFNPRGQDVFLAYDRAAEIILPAIANNGLGCLLNTLGGGTTITVEATVQQ